MHQAALIEAQAPKSPSWSGMGATNGSMCITEVANALKLRPKYLFSWLKGRPPIYRRAGKDSCVGY